MLHVIGGLRPTSGAGPSGTVHSHCLSLFIVILQWMCGRVI